MQVADFDTPDDYCLHTGTNMAVTRQVITSLQRDGTDMLGTKSLAVKIVDVRGHPVKSDARAIPMIPPDPKNALSNYSWNWFRAQPKDVREALEAAEARQLQILSKAPVQASLF